MSTLENMVTTEHAIKPPRVIVYGKPGVGKTTFACGTTKPLIIDLEGSADYIDVPKSHPETFEDVEVLLNALLNENHEFRTIVIDSLDWLEAKIHEYICTTYNAKSVNDKNNQATSYGQGNVLAANMFLGIRGKLQRLRDEKGCAIVLTAHTQIKSRNDPLDGEFDEHTLKMHDKIAAAAVEWADAVLLIKKKTIESSNAPSGKIEGGRILRTDGLIGTTTKNRLYLPPEVPANWSDFVNSINTNKTQEG